MCIRDRVKLVKLNYTSVMSILLKLIHCEVIGDQFHLYMYGDYRCYHGWQYVILIIILPTLALLPICFGMALDLLKRRLISTNMCLISCLMPVICFWFTFKAKRHHLIEQEFSVEEGRCMEEILELEETLFRSDDTSMRWPVVQLYRNLLVVILDTFILNPVFKNPMFTALFVVFLTHDVHRVPFKHDYLNLLQKLTSGGLIFVNLCSLPSSFSSVGDIMAVPYMNSCVPVLRYVDLCLYAAVPLSLPVWTLWLKWNNRTQDGSEEQ